MTWFSPAHWRLYFIHFTRVVVTLICSLVWSQTLATGHCPVSTCQCGHLMSTARNLSSPPTTGLSAATRPPHSVTDTRALQSLTSSGWTGQLAGSGHLQCQLAGDHQYLPHDRGLWAPGLAPDSSDMFYNRCNNGRQAGWRRHTRYEAAQDNAGQLLTI